MKEGSERRVRDRVRGGDLVSIEHKSDKSLVAWSCEKVIFK